MKNLESKQPSISMKISPSIQNESSIEINGDSYKVIKLLYKGKVYEFTLSQVVKGLLYLLGETDE